MPLPSTCRVIVLPDAFVEATPDISFQSIPLEAALQGPWFKFGFDAHLTQYGKADGSNCHRILKPQMSVAQAEGAALHVMLVDLDTPGHTPWADGSKGEQAVDAVEDIIDLAQDAGIPAGGYTSRAGVRIVIPFSPAVPMDKARDVLKGVYAKLKKAVGDVDHLGLEWDDHANGQWTRVFRAPRVSRDGKTLDPYLVMPTGTLNAKAFVEKADVETPTIPVGGRGQRSELNFPVDRWYWAVRPNTKAGVVKHYLRDGKPLPLEEGERNEGVWSVVRSLCAQLGHVFQGADELSTAVYEICADSIIADNREGSPTLEELWDMCARTGPLDAVEPEDAMDLPDGPLVIGHPNGQAYWIQTPERWTGPFAAGTVTTVFRDHYLALPHASDSGVPWDAKRLAYAYGAIARRVTYDFKASGYDDATGHLSLQLYEQRPDVRPTYHEDVAHWLGLLAGDCPVLLDWLSWMGDLSLPLPALVLQGAKGNGKSMLAHALATFWGGEKVDFKAVMEKDFALGPLYSSPLIVGDDISGGFKNSRETGVFREITGNSAFSVNQKFLPVMTLNTCTRTIVTSNDKAVLSIRGRHTAQDLAAIRDRVVAIAVPPTAAEYLDDNGGRQFTADWVPPGGKPGKIVEHLAWLQTQRNLDWTGRFPVSSWVAEELNEGALTSRDEDVEVWLALCQAVKVRDTEAARVHDPGTVYVSVKGLIDRWAALGRGMDTRPKQSELYHILSNASDSTTTTRLPTNQTDNKGKPIRKRYWAVPTKYLVKAAMDVGLDDYEEILRIHENGNTTSLPLPQEDENHG